MRKTTGTSAARKVLCSALSAAMVVAFAPAVGAAVGNTDGVAWAAEEGGQDLTDISTEISASGNVSEGYWLKLTTDKLWNDHLDTVPTVKLMRGYRSDDGDIDNESVPSDCYEVHEGEWYKKTGEQGTFTYKKVGSTAALKAGQFYYLKVTGVEAKGYTGTAWAGFQLADSKNLSNYDNDLSNRTFWSDKTLEIPEVTLTRTVGDKKEILSEKAYAIDKGNLKRFESTWSEVDIPEGGLLAPGNYNFIINPKEGSGYSGQSLAWFQVRNADDLNNYEYSLSNHKFWSDKEAVIPEVTLTRYLDDDGAEGETLEKSQYTVSNKWFTKTTSGTGEDGEEGATYTEATLTDDKLAAGKYYIKVTKGDDDQNPLYIQVTVEDAEDVENYSFRTTYSGFWTDTAIEIPDIEAKRYLGESGWEKLDKSKYSVDKENLYVLDDNGSIEGADGGKYSQVSMPTHKKLEAGDYYVKASMNQKNVFCKITVEDASDISNYEIDKADGDVYNGVLYEGDAAAIPAITLRRLVHGKWQNVDNSDSKVFALSKLLTYRSGVKDDDGTPTDADLEEYKKSSFGKGTYFVKMTASDSYTGTRFVRIEVLDNHDLSSCYAYVKGQVWSDAIPALSSIKVGVEKGNGDVLDSSAYKVDTSSWYREELNDDGDEVYRKCEAPTADKHEYRYLVKLTGNAPYEGSCYADVYINDPKDLGDYSVDTPEKIEVNTSAEAAAENLKIYREVNGKRVELAKDSYTVDGKWYSYDEDADDYKEVQGNPSSAGRYSIKVVPAEGSGYTGVRYVDIIVGDPCENGHDIHKMDAAASTCTVKGNKEYWYCENCDKLFADAAGTKEITDEGSVELPLAAHTRDAGTTVSAATCTTGGKVEYRCIKCGKVVETATTPALGHSFTSGSITWIGGGTSSATGTFTCSRNSSHIETVTASVSKTLTVKPTCTAKGTNTYTATATSSTGTKVTSSKTAQDEPALGHAYGPYTVTVQPTTTSTGVATAKCTRTGCYSTVTKTVEKLKSEQKTSVGGNVSATATVTDAKPSTTPNGTNVVGSVTFDNVTTPASATKIEIPETVTINGAEYAVTGIGSKAIAGNAKVESVKLPETVTELPAGLFEGCSSLKEATLPSKITEIPDDAFNGTALESISIPATVTKVGNRAFKGTELTTVILPESVTSLGKEAFRNCSRLDLGYMPKVLRSVSDYAFDGCGRLKRIVVTELVVGMSVGALENEDAAAPAVVDVSQATYIGANAFRGCKLVTSVDASAAKTIGAGAFSGMSKLASLKTGSGLKSVGKSALSGAKRVKTLTVKSKKLAKAGVKDALKGSSVKTVKVGISGSKATKAKYVVKYKKIFTAKNCGKKVVVK